MEEGWEVGRPTGRVGIEQNDTAKVASRQAAESPPISSPVHSLAAWVVRALTALLAAQEAGAWRGPPRGDWVHAGEHKD